jgi:hypothetical protein
LGAEGTFTFRDVEFPSFMEQKESFLCKREEIREVPESG